MGGVPNRTGDQKMEKGKLVSFDIRWGLFPGSYLVRLTKKL